MVAMPTLENRPHGGFHSTLDQDHPYIFVDATMQIWPDADFAKAHLHGVTAYGVTAWRPKDGLEEVVAMAMEWHRLARQHDNLTVAMTASDIRKAKAEAKAAFIICAQGGDWIQDKLHRVEAMARLGLRQLLFAYNASNLLADGCLDCTEGGLTRLGGRVVEECNRVGILLDGTHTGKRSTLDIIARSSQPTIFSHSNPSALSPNPRNIDDEQIRACADGGGVVCLAPWGPLVMRPDGSHQPTTDEFIDMIDHVVQLTGSADHVGIGTDMSLGTYPEHEQDPWGAPDYGDPFAEYGKRVTADARSPRRNLDGFSDYAEIVSLAARLLERGFSDTEVHKILGENYLRVAEIVWSSSISA